MFVGVTFVPCNAGGAEEPVYYFHFFCFELLSNVLVERPTRFGRRRQNVIKIVYKNEEQRDVCKGADLCISRDFFWLGKRLKWLLKRVGPRRLSLVGCRCCFEIDVRLMFESKVNTFHHFLSIPRVQLSS